MTMIRTIKSLAPKPSDAIKAMLDGLREIPSAEFSVDMGTYGGHEHDSGPNVICCGCAATCAVHKLAGKAPHLDYIDQEMQPEYLGFWEVDLYRFESAIDSFRVGYPGSLFAYYGLYGSDSEVLASLASDKPWRLLTENWEPQLSKIEEYLERVVAAGF